jgi:hypothetical protein
MGRARDLANILSSSGNVALDSELGLSLITPTSIANTGGSASISSTGAVSFTSASAVSLNDVFSSTYQNYRIVVGGTNSSTTLNWQFRLRSSGTDNSVNYFSSEFFIGSNGATGAASYINNGTFIQINTQDNTNTGNAISFDIFKPNDAALTNLLGLGYDGNSAKTKFFGALHNVASSFTGFTILCNTGTISGTVSVYGYRK